MAMDQSRAPCPVQSVHYMPFHLVGGGIIGARGIGGGATAGAGSGLDFGSFTLLGIQVTGTQDATDASVLTAIAYKLTDSASTAVMTAATASSTSAAQQRAVATGSAEFVGGTDRLGIAISKTGATFSNVTVVIKYRSSVRG